MCVTVNIAKEFSMSPGGRYAKNGPDSGEEFREQILKPKYLEAKKRGMPLRVILDGGYGYAPSFLDEAFGGLALETKDPLLLETEIVSEEEPQLVQDVLGYIRNGLAG